MSVKNENHTMEFKHFRLPADSSLAKMNNTVRKAS